MYQPTIDDVAGFGPLLRAFGKARRAKRGKGGEPAFYHRLEENLLHLGDQLRSGAWRPDPYRYFVLFSGKERVVAEATFRDRVVHHALVAAIEPLFEPTFSPQSYACRKGKGAHAAVARAQVLARQHPYALRLDVRRYFDHVDHAVLLGLLTVRIQDIRIVQTCAAILAASGGHPALSVQRPGVGIPIGNLTSQFWANVYLDPLDRVLAEFAGADRCLRYMDDILVFGDDKAALWDRVLAATVCVRDQLQLALKPAATRVAPTSSGIGWLGFVVFPALVRLNPAARRRLAGKLRASAERAALRPTAQATEALRAASVCAHVGHADTLALRQRILAT